MTKNFLNDNNKTFQKIENLIFIETILYSLPKGIKIIEIKNNEIHIYLNLETSEEYTHFILKFFKQHSNLKTKCLSDIIGLDLLNLMLKTTNKKNRFNVIYNILSLSFNKRIYIYKTHLENYFTLSSSSLFDSAVWLEREVWDLFGVFFKNNSDLRRILTDYGFEGFPLRKDFPISGFLEVTYNEKTKSIIYKKNEISQEFRNFKFITPWN